MAEHAAYIVIQGPGHNDTRIALREGITSFGRLPSNDVILLGDLVSRNHARIIFFDGKASLQDLGSHNGSWVNEERIATRGRFIEAGAGISVEAEQEKRNGNRRESEDDHDRNDQRRPCEDRHAHHRH